MAAITAIGAYRHLLRSINLAFQGDIPLITAAKAEARIGFQKYASLQLNDPSLAPAIAHAEEITKFLRENVVQGRKVEGEDDKFKLRIHQHTERGDNDTIKAPGGGNIVIDGKKCSDR